MESVETLVQTYGYWTVLAGTFLEGETVLALGGFAAQRGYLQLAWVMLAAFVGTLAGDQFCFYLGRRHGQATLRRHPAWRGRIDRASELLERNHILLLLVFRFLYGLRSVIPFAVGLSRVRASTFVVFDVLGAAVWATAVGVGGYLFGNAVTAFIDDVKRYELAVMTIVALAGAAVWVGYFAHKRIKRTGKARESTSAAH